MSDNFDYERAIRDLENQLDRYENTVNEQLRFIDAELTRMNNELDNLKRNDDGRLRNLEKQVVSLSDRIDNLG